MNPTLFHLAFPVTDITQAKTYYVDGLGCLPGRENRHALILKLYEHQLVAHVTKETLIHQHSIYPRHFGIIFTAVEDWEDLLLRAQQQQLLFREEPKRLDSYFNSPEDKLKSGSWKKVARKIDICGAFKRHKFYSPGIKQVRANCSLHGKLRQTTTFKRFDTVQVLVTPYIRKKPRAVGFPDLKG